MEMMLCSSTTESYMATTGTLYGKVLDLAKKGKFMAWYIGQDNLAGR